jgi:uncharacterized protein (DUF488 family)
MRDCDRSPPMNRDASLFTIGHSTHPIETLLALLTMHKITLVFDVRSYPSSRRWPQFNQAELKQSLEDRGIAYRWCLQLGGRRNSKRVDSPHTAWEHPAFRSYADHTETAPFETGLEELIEAAREARTAIMCSEGLWWRCHRRIISDHLTMRGWGIMHVMPDGKMTMHALPEFATVTDGRIVYDGGQQSLKLK